MTTSKSQRKNAGDRIVFASCNSQHYDDELSHTLWPAILSRNASAFVWTGDAIYADDFHPPKSYLHYLLGKPSPKPATPPVIRDLYAHLIQSPGYSKLLESNVTILGTLDDHGMFLCSLCRSSFTAPALTSTPSCQITDATMAMSSTNTS